MSVEEFDFSSVELDRIQRIKEARLRIAEAYLRGRESIENTNETAFLEEIYAWVVKAK